MPADGAAATDYPKLHLHIDGEWIGGRRSPHAQGDQPGDRRGPRRAAAGRRGRPGPGAGRRRARLSPLAREARRGARPGAEGGRRPHPRASRTTSPASPPWKRARPSPRPGSRPRSPPTCSNSTARNAGASMDGCWCGPAGRRSMVIKEPVGPVAAFAPWNFPIANPGRKLGGADRRRLLGDPEARRGGARRGAGGAARPARRRPAAGRGADRLRRAGRGVAPPAGLADHPQAVVHRLDRRSASI